MSLNTAIKKGRKYEQVVRGAACVFMRDGFEGASVDEIAREAQVSKATLYSYFPDKRLLFIEVALNEISKQSDLSFDDAQIDADPRDLLHRFGINFINLIQSPLGLGVMRVVIAETERFPELGAAFFEHGPATMERRLASYFAKATQAGKLQVANTQIAAQQFLELCKAGCFIRRLTGVEEILTHSEAHNIINEAVKTFIARYGA